MPPKRKSDASAGDASKKRKTITIENKVEIIKLSERGETPSVTGKALGYSRSMIETILKDKVMIAFEEEDWDLKTPEPKKFLTKELAEAFRLIEAGMAKLEEQDPNTERFTKVYRAVTEGLSCYKAIYDEKKKSSA